MINLIPNEEKKKMSRNFYFRVTAVIFFMLGFCFIFCILVIAPLYFQISLKEGLIKEQLEKQKAELIPEASQKALAISKELNLKISLIEKAEDQKFIVSQKIINEIVLQKMSDIKITQILYDNTAVNGEKKVNIQGTAPSRDRLLLFRQELEGNDSFKTVDLPISNFVKGSNIQFFLSLTPA